MKSERPVMTNFNKTCCLIFAGLILLFSACDRSPNPTATPELDTAANSQKITVALEVDFQGRAENVSLDLQAPPATTVFELLELAKSQNKLEFESSGSGEFAFINSINGIQNERSDGSNWVFFVNDTMSKQGSGVFAVQESDKVLWKFKADGLK